MRLLGIAALIAPTAGCILAGPHPAGCDSSAECRANFGATSVCLDDGYCGIAEPSDGCATPQPVDLFDPGADYGDAILLGASFDAGDDPVVHEAMRLAVDLANQEGGLDGRPIGLAVCDAVGAGTWLGDTLAVPVVVGGLNDASALALRAALPSDTVLVSPGAIGPTFAALDSSASDSNPGRSWTVSPAATLEATAIVADLQARSMSTVALLAQDAPGSSELADAFEAEWGGTVTRYDFDDGSARNSAVASIALAGTVDVVLLAAATDEHAAQVLLNGDTLGVDTAEYFFTSASATPGWLSDASSVSDLFPLVRGTRLPSRENRLVFQHLDSSLAVATGSDASASRYAAEGWDAVWLGMMALAWGELQADGASADNAAMALRSFSQGPPVTLMESGWVDALGRLPDASSIDVDGASSDLDFGDDEQLIVTFRAWEIDETGAMLIDAN